MDYEILDIAKDICQQIEKLDYSSKCAVLEIVQSVITTACQDSFYQVPQE